MATVQDISFWTGLATVFAFSQGRFSEKQGDEEETDPPLPNRYFTSRFRYYSSAALYSGVFVAIYCALIVVGSIPALQDDIKDIFGSLAGSAARSEDEVGTPAWAAMLIMVVAPTIPWVKRHEAALRLWLQEFSDIPFKARQLADEAIRTLLASMNAAGGLDAADEPALFELFARLEQLQARLGATGRPKPDQGYKRFFKEHGELLAKTKGKIKSMRAEFETLIEREPPPLQIAVPGAPVPAPDELPPVDPPPAAAVEVPPASPKPVWKSRPIEAENGRVGGEMASTMLDASKGQWIWRADRKTARDRV